MYPWIIILAVMAVVVFGIDYAVRRKKWNNNTKEEKISLLVNMFSVGVYVFLSILGAFWGITFNSPDSGFGKVVYDVTLVMGGAYFVVAVAAVIASLVLRKKGKVKASIWVNVIALLYIVAVLGINYLVGEFL